MEIYVNPATNPNRLTLKYDFDVNYGGRNPSVTGMVEYEPNDEENDQRVVYRTNMSCGFSEIVPKEVEEACMRKLAEYSPTSIENRPKFDEVDTAWEDDMPA